MNYFRLAIIFVAILALSLLLHLLIYQSDFTYANISDSLFVVSIILFLPSIVATTGAYQTFHGIRYVFRVIASPSFRKENSFAEYKEARQSEIKTTFFKEILVASFIIFIASIILAGVAMS